MLGLEAKDLAEFEKVLAKRRVSKRVGRDRIHWNPSASREYLAKFGYEILASNDKVESKLPIKLCWNMVGLPKVSIFTWAAA